MARRSDLLPSNGGSWRHLIDTLRMLVARELRIRYKGSFFGILWAVFSPLGAVVILQFVFTRILTIAIPHFAAFMYSAYLPWVWFQSSVQTSASALTDNRALVRTPFFAKTLLPWAVTCTNFLLYLLALPVLLGLLVYDGVPLTPALVALPAVWMALWILTLGFSMLVAAIGSIVRDVQHLITVVLLFWFYLTPIFYDLNQAPPDLARLFQLNPMAAIVMAHRDVTLYGRFPDWISLGSVSAVSAGVLVVGLILFRSLEDVFVEEA